ncbi:MAG: glycosyltransferase [Desulfamplus sp.]|nr:glycosyltransferase [Desulfamplus sp.]
MKNLISLGFNIRIFYVHERGEYVDEARQLGASFGIKNQRSVVLEKVSLLPQLLRISDSVNLVVGMIDGSPSYLTAIISFLRKIPSLCWLHGMHSDFLKNASMWHSFASNVFHPLINQWICVSHAVKTDFIQKKNFPDKKISVIYNPVDFEQIYKLSKISLSSDLQEWFQHDVIIGVGRLSPEKNFPLLLKAFSLLPSELLKTTRLLIIGDGLQRVELENLVQQSGLNHFIKIIGFQRNPYALIARSKILVSPSQTEGCPLAVVEALLLKTPVIGTVKQLAMYELLEPPLRGSVVAHNEQSIAEEIQRILVEQKEFYSEISELRNKFDVEKIILQYVDVIQRLIGCKKTR